MEEYYKSYSNKNHEYSQKLTDRQFMFVDWCLCKAMEEMAVELQDRGCYTEYTVEQLVDIINNVLAGECIWNDAENYEEWYDEDEQTTIDNILDGIEAIWGDWENVVEDGVEEVA